METPGALVPSKIFFKKCLIPHGVIQTLIFPFNSFSVLFARRQREGPPPSLCVQPDHAYGSGKNLLQERRFIGQRSPLCSLKRALSRRLSWLSLSERLSIRSTLIMASKCREDAG